MVLLDEDYTICTIRNTIENSEIKKLSLTVRPSYTVSKLYSDVRTQLDINDFTLVLENLPSASHIPLSLKENKTLGEAGIVFKKAHRNIILVLPSSAGKSKVEKSVSQKNLISNAESQADEPKDTNKGISTSTEICDPVVEAKLDAPAKKKIIKLKTVKTGTKTVKIKSEKTTTVTLENGVTEVKKKTIKKQTDTTTILLPNGITNGVTSEECTVTKSIHTTNGDHFEQKNIEITSTQSDNIDPDYIEKQLGLVDRRSSSAEIDSIAGEQNHLKVSTNGFEDKSLRKDRSASPIEIASYNFVVGKKNLKPKVVTEPDSFSNSDIEISIKSQEELSNTWNETNGNVETIEEVNHEESVQSNSTDRSETSPARFEINLNDLSTVPINKNEKEVSTPFLRSEVSPARFTIKLAKKKAEIVEPEDTKDSKDPSVEPELELISQVNNSDESKLEKTCDSGVNVTPEEPISAVEVDRKVEVAPESELPTKVEVVEKEETVFESETILKKASEPAVESNQEIHEAKVNHEIKENIVTPADEATQLESLPKTEVSLKEKVGTKTETTSKVDVNNTEVPKVKIVRKTEGGVGVKTVKTKIASKDGDTEKGEIGLKDVVLKKVKKVSDAVNGLPADGTTEVKKKLVKKVKDSTSSTGEVKKKVVKKVVGVTGATENGTGEVKKLIKKKVEVSNSVDVAPEVKVKVVKKKVENNVADQEILEEPPKSNSVEDPKVEDTLKLVSQEVAPEIQQNHLEEKVETKMDEVEMNHQNGVSSLDVDEKKESDPTLLLPDEDAKNRSMLELDDSPSLRANAQKYFDETPLFISTTQSEQPDLSLGLSSDKNRRERQMLGMDEDLALGASASPVESKSETSNNYIPLAICDTPSSSSTNYAGKIYSGPKLSYGYVGLVNQAMTCYLNSLLQALYMTPEFRNALYNWEFDGHEESKSIPYQLQKLFLNLQTSTKVAIETTDLTKSFGWTSSDAWHQHDVQELCRVMFDALEQKFKNTKQADLINRLYEGKMIDYVKCLECSTEKTREDTLLDIPLPVRPFGSNMAYGSVEEALQAFVQPETLDGNNQYFCDKCDKKCDAHKGLKFTRFPYILTLHLKRFDFDYNTLHRIKLNDKVTFPQLLNLNSFVKESDNISFVQHANGCSSEHGSIESAIKCDDCSTTDSGSALEEDGTSNLQFTGNNNNDGDLQYDDEGIDMSTSNTTSHASANESGPYMYELFAIMIHSGSASGGHYYAYIKDFNNGEWYCFNDQTVSSASQEDIQRSFGGGSAKTYYSSAYNSSTNAYMLMYRQQDSLRNDAVMKVEEFPPHIKKLLNDLRQREETERQNKARETEMLKLKVHFFNPKTQRMQDAKFYMPSDSDLKTTLEDAYSHFNLEKLVPIERCRLVGYCHSDENIIRSYEGKEDEMLTKVLYDLNPLELLLEVRAKDAEFEVYPPGGVLTKLYKVDLATGDVDVPIVFRAITFWTVPEYKTKIAEKLNLNVDQIILAVLKPYSNNARIIDDDVPHRITKQDRVFAAISTSPYDEGRKLTKIVERFEHLITLYFLLPATDKETLEKMSIPSYVEKPIQSPMSTSSTTSLSPRPPLSDSTDVVDAVMHAAPLSTQNHTTTSDYYRNYNVPLPLELESCSEDSSLSDGDRTLVDSAPEMADVSSTNNSPTCSDTQMSSMEYNSKRYNDFDCDDDNETVEVTKARNYYFKAVYFEEPYKDVDNVKTNRMLKVLVDKGMIIGNLKRALEPYIKVPKEYFKIFKTTSNTETECHRLTESLCIFSDNERLVIELGRALRKGEYKCKISYLKLSEVKDDMEQLSFMCDWILRNGANVGQTKREIVAHLSTLGHDIPYDKCRLRHQNRRLPMEIYLDDQKFGDDIRLSENAEVILQELEETSQPYTDANDKCIFIRQWHPSTMKIGGFQEITISENSELKNVLSSVSGIPEENIEYAMPSGLFPRYNLNVLTMHTTSLTWCWSTVKADEWPLNSAHNSDCFIFRDKTEPLKQLTPDEIRDLKSKQERLRVGGTYSTYSPRRERGLKIDV
ncbi:Ubiquitin carboxyl-terminal hydrolase 47 [Pseudolycoriella hygida]|uniref:Ubiquitin carboxyl-terminal hydrolase 47 n=1 Tax=Pseudolycoriella hygida TaxID=35572 RepID=A0A9Q0S272_9DIPT|nr:Ubiquitin carboxyl-terminal hydrolase 47 [Pseudolycoriella hygida]